MAFVMFSGSLVLKAPLSLMVHMSLPVLIQCGATVILSGNLSVSTDRGGWAVASTSHTHRRTTTARGAVDRRVSGADRCWLGFRSMPFYPSKDLACTWLQLYRRLFKSLAPFASVASLGTQPTTTLILAA